MKYGLKHFLLSAEATEPKRWQWPQLPNPFGHTPQPEETHLMRPQHTAASPMPASLSHKQPQQARNPSPDPQNADRKGARSADTSAKATQDSPAAPEDRTAQTAGQPFWVLQPWRQKHADKAPAGSQGRVSGNVPERKRSSAAAAEHNRNGWSLPRLKNPFEGWGRSVSPGDA